MEGDDPPSQDLVTHVPQPRLLHHRASESSGRGKAPHRGGEIAVGELVPSGQLAQDRDGMVEPELVELLEHGDAWLGYLQADDLARRGGTPGASRRRPARCRTRCGCRSPPCRHRTWSRRAKGRSSTSPCTNSTYSWLRPHFSRATSSICSDTSARHHPALGGRRPAEGEREIAGPAADVQSRVAPARPAPAATPSSRQRWCRPAVIRSFKRS